MQEHARKSPSTLERFSQTRAYSSNLLHMTTECDTSQRLHYRISGRVATDIVFSNALLVVSIWTIKEWLLSQNVGAFWVRRRVLACGALGLVMREVASGDASKALEAASSAKVCTTFLSFFFGITKQYCGMITIQVDRAGHGLRCLFSSTREPS